MDKPYAVAWAVVSKDTSKGLNVVYHSLCHTRAEAYHMAGKMLGDPVYSTEQMHRLGFIAKRVRITLEE